MISSPVLHSPAKLCTLLVISIQTGTPKRRLESTLILACRSFASKTASVVRQPIWNSPLGGVDPDDVEVAVVDALLVFVGVASAAPGSPPQRPAVSPGPAAAARRRRRRLAALPLLPAQRRRARLAAGRHGARPGQRGPCSRCNCKSKEEQ